MAFSAGELSNIANAALDYYIDKGNVLSQTIQNKPLLKAMDAKAKSFPGGKGDVNLAVKGAYTTTVAGYTHNDTVTYANPANIVRANYTWREHHAGISLTHTELKHDGISVVDTDGAEVSQHSGRDMTVLANLLEDKLEDMMEGYARGMNTLLWGDGVAAPKAIAGIRAFVTDDPTTGTVGGINRATSGNEYWRNRSLIGASKIATTDDLVETIHTEMRQLRRYGGRPNIALCGSTFLDRLVTDLRDKGNYTQTGFAKGADISIGEINYNGVTFQYDPSLDDLGTSGSGATIVEYPKRCYILDTNHLYLMYMDGEKMKRHSPTRPADQYVLYRAITTTAVVTGNMLNCHGVYQIA